MGRLVSDRIMFIPQGSVEFNNNDLEMTFQLYSPSFIVSPRDCAEAILKSIYHHGSGFLNVYDCLHVIHTIEAPIKMYSKEYVYAVMQHLIAPTTFPALWSLLYSDTEHDIDVEVDYNNFEYDYLQFHSSLPSIRAVEPTVTINFMQYISKVDRTPPSARMYRVLSYVR